mmetsp:Transcript_28226/g.64571  ORF Transcript_28226/g.64571 Transcript_28226/m.64571 type:complete len:127 (-) Transcript_28226:488-868(-)
MFTRKRADFPVFLDPLSLEESLEEFDPSLEIRENSPLERGTEPRENSPLCATAWWSRAAACATFTTAPVVNLAPPPDPRRSTPDAPDSALAVRDTETCGACSALDVRDTGTCSALRSALRDRDTTG